MQEQEYQEESFGDKALSTAYKVGGWNLRLKAIGSLIMGILLFLGGIILAIISKSFNALILSLIGLVAFFGSWIYWKRSNSLVKGRFY